MRRHCLPFVLIACTLPLFAPLACSHKKSFTLPALNTDAILSALESARASASASSSVSALSSVIIAKQSCIGLPQNCGPAPGMDCCTSYPVPSGSYNRRNDPKYRTFIPAFELDAFEVTVGRFKKFIAAWDAVKDELTKQGTGAGLRADGTYNPGWQAAWNKFGGKDDPPRSDPRTNAYIGGYCPIAAPLSTNG